MALQVPKNSYFNSVEIFDTTCDPNVLPLHSGKSENVIYTVRRRCGLHKSESSQEQKSPSGQIWRSEDNNYHRS